MLFRQTVLSYRTIGLWKFLLPALDGLFQYMFQNPPGVVSAILTLQERIRFLPADRKLYHNPEEKNLQYQNQFCQSQFQIPPALQNVPEQEYCHVHREGRKYQGKAMQFSAYSFSSPPFRYIFSYDKMS